MLTRVIYYVCMGLSILLDYICYSCVLLLVKLNQSVPFQVDQSGLKAPVCEEVKPISLTGMYSVVLAVNLHSILDYSINHLSTVRISNCHLMDNGLRFIHYSHQRMILTQ